MMKEEKTMKKAKSFIGIIIAVLLIVVLVNPQWIVPGKTADSLRQLEDKYLFNQSSGMITLAHIFTLIVSICIVWLIYTALKMILQAIARRNDRSKTVNSMLIGVLKYVAVLAAIVWGLSILGVNTTTVLAGVGILGLVLGFGAQRIGLTITFFTLGFFFHREGRRR